jgi:hypothetical protein
MSQDMNLQNNKLPSLEEFQNLIQNGVTPLNEHLLNYKKFLYLAKTCPKFGAVPTKEIDEIWHLHLAFSDLYEADCLRFLGRLIKHKEHLSIDDRTILRSKFHETAAIWANLYGESYESEDKMAICGIDDDEGGDGEP